MKNIILIFLILLFLNGCGSTLYNFRQHSKLSSAIELLKQGEKDNSVMLLKEISNEKGVHGVTDEAMFMLALVYLDSSYETEKFVNSKEVLERLQKEYPASIWALQSNPIIELIVNIKLARESKNGIFQEVNYLRRENKKLKLNIERLKTLDLELEQRPRR